MPRSQHTSSSLVWILSFLAALGIFATSIYLPSMPAIGDDLQASQASVQLTLTFFFIGSAVGQLLLGPLSDRYGRLPVAYFGLALFAASSFWCGMSNDIVSLQGGRFVQGMAAASGPLIARTIARDLLSGPQLTRMISTIMMAISLSPAVAPAVGGVLQEHFDWRANFYFLMIFAMSIFFVVRFYLPETNPSHKSENGLLKNTLRGYSMIFRDLNFVASSLLLGSLYAGVFGFITMSPYIFIKEFSWSPQEYILVTAVMALGNILGFSLSRKLSLSVSLRTSFVLGVLVALGVNIVLAILGYLNLASSEIVLIYTVISFGSIGFAAVSGSTIVMTRYSPSIAGSVAAVLGAIQIGSGAISSALAGLLDDTPMMAGMMIAGFIGTTFLIWFFVVGRHPYLPLAQTKETP